MSNPLLIGLALPPSSPTSTHPYPQSNSAGSSKYCPCGIGYTVGDFPLASESAFLIAQVTATSKPGYISVYQ